MADAHGSDRMDRPRKIDPEFVLFPHFAWIRLVGVLEFFSRALAQYAIHRLAKADPFSRVRFLAHQVVTFRAESHGQYVIGEPRGLAPGGRERGMQAEFLLVAQHFDPGKTVGIGPDWIEYAREVSFDAPASFFQKVRQQERHLMH